MTTTQTAKRDRTTPVKITQVDKKLPATLVLYQMQASPYWYTRYFSTRSGRRKIYRKSTKTKDLKEAKVFARRFYEDILLQERNTPLSDRKNKLYKVVWKEYYDEQVLRDSRKEVNPRWIKNVYHSGQRVLKAFGDLPIKQVDFKVINQLYAECSKDGLSPETIRKIAQNIRSVLKYAYREKIINEIPLMPTIKRKDNPRGWFSPDEYEVLKKTTRSLIKQKVSVHYSTITDEMRFFITFMVNTFLRPSPDARDLKHKNIEIVEKKDERYLLITTESSKTSNRPVVSMEAGIGIYKDIVAFHKKNNRPTDKEDYVFLPEFKNRNTAYQNIQRMFKTILREAELEYSPHGEKRSVYSLRHTAISFRLLMGDVDAYTLARNARTSTEVIERFYASHLSNQQLVKKLQSFKN